MDKVAAVWARVSSPGQKDPSLDSQVVRSRDKLESEGYIVNPEHIFQVVWTSTDLQPCPNFQQLQRLIQERKIQAVGMLDRDRIEADGLQRLIFFGLCKDNGVQVIIYQGPPFIDGSEGQLVELALSLGKDKANIRAQIGAKQGLEDRAKGRSKKNNYQELPPTKMKVYGMKWKDGMYRPDDNYDNTCLIFDLWFERQKKEYIARELFKRGIPTSSGKTIWQTSSLSAILLNPVYAGRVATLKYEKVEPQKRSKNTTFGKSSAHLKPEEEWHWLAGNRVEKPIITWQQHLEIRRWMALNKANSKRNNKHQDLARGIIECMFCRRKYYAVQPSSGGRRKYVCSNHWAQPAYVEKCPAKSLDQEEVDNRLKAKLRQFLENPKIYLEEAKLRQDVGITKEEIDRRIKDLEKQKQQTIDEERRKANILSDEAFNQEQALILTRRKWLVEEIDRERANLANLQTYSVQRQTIESMRHRLQHNLDNATFDDWGFIRDALGAKILSFGDGTWDIRVNVPARDVSIVNKTPWYISPG